MSCSPLAERVPEDILPAVFEKLTDRRDLHACSLVSCTFNRAATPILYRSLDTRILLDLPSSARLAKQTKIFHLFKILLSRRELLQYVRYARGTGTIHEYGTELFDEYLTVLGLCTHLQTFTWIDDRADRMTRQPHSDPVSYDITDQSLRGIIRVLQGLKIEELTIRTYSGLSEDAWTEMRMLSGLRKLSLWCMEGRPRVLQGWCETLGSTLTHLDLGRTQGVPATILLSVLSELPLLQSLALKGAPSSCIPDILTFLPDLTSLDVDYSSGAKVFPPFEPLVARLKYLTVRTNDLSAAQRIWSWIKQLVPYPSLEYFKLSTFAVHSDASPPRSFILDLARIHGGLLKQFHMSGAALTLQDVQCLCTRFPELEVLSWSLMFINDIAELGDAIAGARKLRALKVDADWVSAVSTVSGRWARFGTDDAIRMMKDSPWLRDINVCGTSFKGGWVPVTQPDGLTEVEFEIVRDANGSFDPLTWSPH